MALTTKEGNKLLDDNDKAKINGTVINMFARTQLKAVA